MKKSIRVIAMSVLTSVLVLSSSVTGFAGDNTYVSTNSESEIVVEFIDGMVVDLGDGMTVEFSIREEEPPSISPFLVHLGTHDLTWTRRQILSDFPIFRTTLEINNVSWNPAGTRMDGLITSGSASFNIINIPVNGWATVRGIPSFQTWRLEMWLNSNSSVGPGRFAIYVHDIAE